MARWRRTPCDTSACVEVGRLAWGDFAVRNSAFRARTVTFTKKEMRGFIAAVKNGHFDDLMEDPK